MRPLAIALGFGATVFYYEMKMYITFKTEIRHIKEMLAISESQFPRKIEVTLIHKMEKEERARPPEAPMRRFRSREEHMAFLDGMRACQSTHDVYNYVNSIPKDPEAGAGQPDKEGIPRGGDEPEKDPKAPRWGWKDCTIL